MACKRRSEKKKFLIINNQFASILSNSGTKVLKKNFPHTNCWFMNNHLLEGIGWVLFFTFLEIVNIWILSKKWNHFWARYRLSNQSSKREVESKVEIIPI